MKDFKKKMENYCNKQNKLSNKMMNLIIDFVNANGGEIDTSNENYTNDNIYALVYDEFSEKYSDFKIHKVRTINGYLEIYIPDCCSENENELWLNVMGAMCLFNATLYNLCECLWEYVE